MAVFRKDNIIFSLNSFAAATLALFIALWIGLPRPFWAMMTVYITSQPLAGAVRSKAVYRLAGTLLGATVAVILVPNFVNQPLLLSFMLALWAGVCVAVSLLDRTPASYTLLLAGYTASLIGFPSVDHPEAIFDLAWSRSVEIGLGVICAALMHSLVFPRPVSRVIALRVTDWIHRADIWLNDLLDEERASQTLGDRRAFALAASDIRILGSHLPFDTERRGDAQGLLHAIHDRMLLLIPHLEAVGDRLGELNRLGGPSEAVGAQLDKAKAWIQSGAPPMEGLDLSDALRYGTQSEAPNTWRDLVQQSLATRLGEAVQALSEAHLLHRRIENPTFPLPPTLQTAISSAMPKPLHADIGLAVRSGVTLIVTVMATSLLWITTGWPDGAGAAAMASVFCALFASLDDPSPAILYFAVCSLLSLVVGAVYNFAIFQMDSSFGWLALTLFPSLFFLGALAADPKNTAKATPLIITLVSALGVQQAAQTDFAAYLNANLAIYAGILVAVFIIRELRSMTAEDGIQRLSRLTRTYISRLALRRVTEDRAHVLSRLVDRVSLVAARLSADEATGDDPSSRALRDLGVALDVATIRDLEASVPTKDAEAIEAVMREVGQFYAAHAKDPEAAPSDDRLSRLDQALRCFTTGTDQAHRTVALSLVDLRRSLFPAAQAFLPAQEIAL